MNKVFALPMMVLLVGCATKSKSVNPTAVNKYTQSVQDAVRKNYFGFVGYQEHGCTLKVTQTPGGNVKRVEVVSVDSFLCQRSVEAVNDTVSAGTFPEKPSGLPESILFDFKP